MDTRFNSRRSTLRSSMGNTASTASRLVRAPHHGQQRTQRQYGQHEISVKATGVKLDLPTKIPCRKRPMSLWETMARKEDMAQKLIY